MTFLNFEIKFIDINRFDLIYPCCTIVNCYNELSLKENGLACSAHGFINNHKYEYQVCLHVKDETAKTSMSITPKLAAEILTISANDFKALSNTEVNII